ncbi:hypothetical protein, partial [Xanthomonas oryzae]
MHQLCRHRSSSTAPERTQDLEQRPGQAPHDAGNTPTFIAHPSGVRRVPFLEAIRMKIKRFVAPDMRTAFRMVREEH